MLKGIGASQGYGIGKAVIINDMNTDYSNIEYSNEENEKARLKNAVESFTAETNKLAEQLKKSAGEKEAEILAVSYTHLTLPTNSLV